MAYFPNGCAGEVLAAQCADCPLGFGWNDPNQPVLFDTAPEAKPCPVALVQMLYNYDQLRDENKQLREALTLLVDEEGVCTTRKLLLECRKDGTLNTT